MSVTKHTQLMLILLWGLIFAKCLILEYLVQVYSVPINSFFYVWTLTLTMAGLATVVFFRNQNPAGYLPEKVSLLNLIWLGCAAVCLTLIGVLSLLTHLNPYAYLTIIAVMLGIGYLIHGILTKNRSYTCSGIGWWIGAATLATRNNALESLPLFAFLIVLLTVLPLIFEMRRQKIAFL